MAINFSGEFTTPRSPEEVYDFLSDPNRFAPLLPDYQSMSMQDATHFTVKVKVGVGNIRGSAEIKMELTEAAKPQRAQYKGQGTAVGSQVNVIAGFNLEPNGSTTKVLWNGETSVFGKLASMAGGMLEPLGRKNIQKLIEGLQKALAEPLPVEQAPNSQVEPGLSAGPRASSPEIGSSTPSNGDANPKPPMEAQSFTEMNNPSENEGAAAPPPESHGNDNA